MSSSYELGDKMRSGALWVYLQGWLGAVLQFGAGIVVARIMDPADFGVFYAVNAYTAILGQQVNFGIPNALLQAKDLEDSQWNSAFWIMEGIAIFCTLLVLGLADWLAQFYGDPRYTSIMRFACINFFIMPYMFINGSILRRKMDYKTVSHILMISSLSGIVVSITLALLGFGPYSLLISGISSSFLSALLMVRKAPWHPHFSFDWEGLKPLVGFGWRLHLNNSLSMFAGRVDNMMVGSIMGVAGLGIYNRAFNLSRMPVTEITGRLYQIFFTGFSRIQDDLEHTGKMYKKILCGMTTAVFPFLIVLVLQGDGVILFLYGEKWLPAANPLKIMALGSFPFLIAVTLGSLADAQNLVAKETPIQIFNIIGTVMAVMIGGRWGLVGISVGIAAKSFLLLLLLQLMVSRSHVRLSYKEVFEAAFPAFIASVASFVVGWATEYGLDLCKIKAVFIHLCGVCGAVFLSYGIAIFAFSRSMPNNEALSANIKVFSDIWNKIRLKLLGLKPFSGDMKSRERT